MVKIIILLSAIILSCILRVHADPPVSSYSIGGDNNGYEYNNNIMTGAYIAGKDPLTSGRNQGGLDESLRSSSFSGFTPSSHNNGYQGYSSTARENLGTNSYFLNDPTPSSFEGFANSHNNGDSSLDGFAASSDQIGSNFNQFSSTKHKNSAYAGFADNVPGASNAGGYSELTPEGSAFRDYSEDSFRSHATGSYMDGDHVYNKESFNVFNAPNTDYSYGKHKDSVLSMGNSNKYANDMYTLHSDTRYNRGNHGNMGRDYASPMYSSNSALGSPFASIPNTRGSASLYAPSKISKYNKYSGDYASNTGVNYLPKDQDTDYLLTNYGKGTGKVTMLKDSRPSSYTNQPYLSGPSYLSKLVGNYKSKPSYISYPSSSHVAYSPMSNLHSYGDNPTLRRYRSSSGHIPGHPSTYSGYF